MSQENENLARLRIKKEEIETQLKNSGPLSGDDKILKSQLSTVEKLIGAYSKDVSEKLPTSEEIDQVFNKVHGFAKQKEDVKSFLRVQNYLNKRGINTQQVGKILCFAGPAGVGKTLFASKIAEALGRKFFPLPVGGKSESEIINGWPSAYVGAKIGGIIKAVKETESYNPIILFDEAEKIGEGNRGSLKDALLHVLDPEQNKRFVDQYLDVELDISHITFILTVNDLEKLPSWLKSRLEVITLEGYSQPEKIAIGKLVIERCFQEIYENANKELFEFKDEAWDTLINKTKEKGARQLKKGIHDIIHWCFNQWALSKERGKQEEKIVIDSVKVNEIIVKDFPPVDEEVKNYEEEDRERRIPYRKEDENRSKFQLPTIENSKKSQQCDICQKKTLQTIKGNCSFCSLKQIQNQIIKTEDLSNAKVDWEGQKAIWRQQIDALENGNVGEKEYSQQIKLAMAEIELRFQQNNKSEKDLSEKSYWCWAVGGGVILVVIGIGLFFWKRKKVD